jgi:hypothetical protein
VARPLVTRSGQEQVLDHHSPNERRTHQDGHGPGSSMADRAPAKLPSIAMTRLCRNYTAENTIGPVKTALMRPTDARIFSLFLLATHASVQFNPASGHWLDVAEFQSLTGRRPCTAAFSWMASRRG